MNNDHTFKAVILMGVSGCGKTTVGRLLSGCLGWDFIESDDFHSKEDVRKMSSDIPLTDEDRLPWLHRLHEKLMRCAQNGEPVVLACSALKQSYRDLLSEGLENVFFVYLRGDFDLIYQRMQQRQHYMKSDMLKSQFDALEEPEHAPALDITEPPEQLVAKIIKKLNLPTG